MNNLEKARIEINEIDKQMAILFEKRFETIKQVIEYKINNRLPITDSEREQTLLQQNLSYITNEDLKNYYRLYFESLMEISKKYQIAYIDAK